MDTQEKTLRVLPKISPADIATDGHFWNAFGKTETEVSARWIVLYCKARGIGWAPVKLADLIKFYQEERERPGETFLFNGLRDPRFLTWVASTNDDDAVFKVTGEFVARCFLSSPAPHVDSSTVDDVRGR